MAKAKSGLGGLANAFGGTKRRSKKSKSKGLGLLAQAGDFGRRKGRKARGGSVLDRSFEGIYKKSTHRANKASFLGMATGLGSRIFGHSEDHRHRDKYHGRYEVFGALAHIEDRGERWAKYTGMKQDFSPGFREWVQDSLVEYEADDVQEVIKNLPVLAHDERWELYRKIKADGLNGRKLPTAVVTYIQDEIVAIEHPAQQGKGSFFQRLFNRMRFRRDE